MDVKWKRKNRSFFSSISHPSVIHLVLKAYPLSANNKMIIAIFLHPYTYEHSYGDAVRRSLHPAWPAESHILPHPHAHNPSRNILPGTDETQQSTRLTLPLVYSTPPAREYLLNRPAILRQIKDKAVNLSSCASLCP